MKLVVSECSAFFESNPWSIEDVGSLAQRIGRPLDLVAAAVQYLEAQNVIAVRICGETLSYRLLHPGDQR